MRFVPILMAVGLSTAAAWAEDVALLIGNEDYANGRDIAAADEVLDAGPALEEVGFKITEGEDADAEILRQLVSSFQSDADGSGRIAIVLAGHFVQSFGQSWFLGADADAPDLGNVGVSGLLVDVIFELAARAPGQAVVLLGTEERSFDLGAGLSSGLRLPDIPQGVTVITGPANDIADFAKDVLPAKGLSLAVALRDWPSLTGAGFMAPLVPFLGSDGVALPPPVDPNADDRAFWQATQAIGTIEAYEGYLDRYANGVFAAEARTQIARIEAEPGLRAEADEKALGLSRNARREIQRALSLLGFDPRGIDGVFGRGSRAAISNWQKDNGEAVTGYVNRAQIELLQTQAERRAAELEEEARIRQVELERKDRAYWEATGAEGDEAGLRAYLERYPDGVFAEIATARLEPFEEARRSQAEAQDRADWDAAQSVGSVAAYQGYLQSNPNGAFADQARAEIETLTADRKNSAALEAAQRTEANLRLNQNTRRLVEDRLDKLGLKPGEVDGNFDDRTRRAIRRYQDARKLTKTGYLNQSTVVRLLADSILR